jgi:phosphoribosyl-AMP cyclohydrolase
MGNDWLDMVKWTDEGLVPAVAQDGTILMLAWMNCGALRLTAREGMAVYWSRLRRRLWRKGEESGHEQLVKDIRLVCAMTW